MTDEEIIKEADRRKDFVAGDDGFIVFWPTRIGGGALDARLLRLFADELDRRNAGWAAKLAEALNKS